MDFHQQWQTLKQDNRIPLVMIVVVAVLLIYTIYSFVTDFSVDTSALSSQSSVRIAQLAPVSQWHLFGRYDDSTQVLPITQLQLSLQGIMLSPGDQEHSYVIIQSPTVTAKVYKVGDQLPGDAVLRKILKDSVVLEYQGTLQSLLLPRPKLLFNQS